MEKINEELREKFVQKVDEIFEYDKNKDKKLDVEEILNFETKGENLNKEELNEIRKSIKKFVGDCNIDGDNTISKEELLENYKFRLS